MVLLSGCEAMAVTSEVLEKVQKLKDEHPNEPVVLAVLGEIETLAMSIRELAKGGWY